MRYPRSRSARNLLVATPLLLAVSLHVFASGSAANGFEPLVYDGPSLDSSITVLDKAIQDHYAKEQMLASLFDPVSDQDRFETVAAAENISSARDLSSDISDFGPVIFDDPSLESNLMVLNENLLLHGDDLFLTIAENPSNSGASVTRAEFDYVAAILDGVLAAEARREAERNSQTLFGTLVSDDTTLDKNIAFLNEEIRKRANREVMLAGDEPLPVTGSSFGVAAYAMAVGFK